MLKVSMMVGMICEALRAFAPTAFAQPQPGMSDMSGMSGSRMQGMGSMSGGNMSGMNMQDMMKHCAQMHQQMSQGKHMAPDMQKMMKQCRQMDSGMKTDTNAPSATQDR